MRADRGVVPHDHGAFTEERGRAAVGVLPLVLLTTSSGIPCGPAASRQGTDSSRADGLVAVVGEVVTLDVAVQAVRGVVEHLAMLDAAVGDRDEGPHLGKVGLGQFGEGRQLDQRWRLVQIPSVLKSHGRVPFEGFLEGWLFLSRESL